MVETEGVLSARESTFKFISRSMPITAMYKLCVQPKSRVNVTFRMPFCEDISGMAIAKLWDPDVEISTVQIRLKNNHGIVEFVNNTNDDVTFLPKTVIGIFDPRSLGYFKVNYEKLVRRMGEYFTFFHYYKGTPDGTSDPIFNRMHETSNDIRQDTNSTKDPYLCLEPDDPRRHHTDVEILGSQISLRGWL